MILKGDYTRKKPMSTNFENKILPLVNSFEAISLETMDKVSFLKRRDTKYVLPIWKLAPILEVLQEDYFILIIKESGIQKYRTIYYDTKALDMYFQHHNGWRKRYKIRTRHYLNSDEFFTEVKIKNNKGITSKKRLRGVHLEYADQELTAQFIPKHSPFQLNELEASVSNSFSRITLINKQIPERLTIDFNLSFTNQRENVTQNHSHLCILETKRSQNEKNRKLTLLLKEHSVFPMGFSKYAIGLSMLDRTLKNNRFKTRIQQLKKQQIIN